MPLPQRDFFTAQDYWALPEGTRAELIDGELYSMAPPSRKHQEIVSGLVWLLRDYIQHKGGPCKAYVSPFAVNLNADDSTYVEPDVLVVCDSSKLSDRGCEGAPDFVVEVVSPSSVRMDYVKKLKKNNEITEDDQKKAEKDLQDMLDKYIKKVDAALAAKDKELMSI